MKGRALTVASALFLGALFARGMPSCTSSTVGVIPPMGYNQQVCLSVSSPVPGCVVPTPPGPGQMNPTVPVTLALNSTFALRPPGACAANALNNCGHVIFYVDSPDGKGQCTNQSASLITDVQLTSPSPGPTTITALLVDDCNNPWTLVWDDAGLLEDGGVMCLPDAGPNGMPTSSVSPQCPGNAPAAPPVNVTNTCPADASATAAVDIGPYFASVTINVQPSCGDAGLGGSSATSTVTTTATSSVTTTGTGGATTGMGGAAGTGGASTATSSATTTGTGGASTATSSATTTGTGGAATATSSATTTGAGGASTATSSATTTGTGGAATGTGGGDAGSGDAGDAGTGGAGTGGAGTGGAADAG